MRRITTATVFCAVVLLSSGCARSKLSHEETFDLPLDGKTVTIDAVKHEQKVHVVVTASDAPVGVFIYLDRDRDKAEDEILSREYSAIILARAEKTEQANLEATIPANSVAVVHITRAGKNTKVKLKITN